MKHLLTLILIASCFITTAQEFDSEFKTNFRNDLCACFSNDKDEPFNEDECFELSTTKYESEITKVIDLDSEVTPYDQGVIIGQELFYDSQEKLIATCDAYYEYFNSLREDAILEMKEAFDQNILTSLTIKISEEPTAEYFWSRGNLYFAIDSFDRALSDFESAIALDPSYAQANFSKAWIFERQEKFLEAIALYEEAKEKTGIREMSIFIALAKRKFQEKNE